jgi:hypothetical protein
VCGLVVRVQCDIGEWKTSKLMSSGRFLPVSLWKVETDLQSGSPDSTSYDL